MIRKKGHEAFHFLPTLEHLEFKNRVVMERSEKEQKEKKKKRKRKRKRSEISPSSPPNIHLQKHQLLTRTCLNCEASLGGRGEVMTAGSGVAGWQILRKEDFFFFLFLFFSFFSFFFFFFFLFLLFLLFFLF